MPLWSLDSLLILLPVFLLAGTVKGVVGFGLPTVALALLTAGLGLEAAMALLLFPSLVTNLWQALAGGQALAICRRIWPFLLPATLAIPLGGLILAGTSALTLTALLGALLMAYALLGLFKVSLTLAPRQEAWVGPLAGLCNGLLTGMTGSFVVPGLLFLQSLALPRDRLVQAMGLLFTLSTLGLGLSLGGLGLLSGDLALLSLLAVLPALAGMQLGQRLRQALSEALFRRIFFLALLPLGLTLLLRGV
ncbi:MAG: sulfite exporter TauE/SafE family protein [Rhodospirillales bacterium]